MLSVLYRYGINIVFFKFRSGKIFFSRNISLNPNVSGLSDYGHFIPTYILKSKFVKEKDRSPFLTISAYQHFGGFLRLLDVYGSTESAGSPQANMNLCKWNFLIVGLSGLT